MARGEYRIETVSDEQRIASILEGEGVIVEPAYACRFDGFVNDTFTEYRNPSIFRPDGVRRAKLESTVSLGLRWPESYYLGFTMYDTAGAEETVDVWLGHRRLATVRADGHDNRVHLYVVSPKLRLKGGETVRLVTGKDSSPYRIEHIVLLPRKPRPSKRTLAICRPHVEVEALRGGCARAVVTWVTTSPSVGEITADPCGEGAPVSVQETRARSCHRAVLDGLIPDRTYRVQILARTADGRMAESRPIKVETRPRTPRSRVEKGTIPLTVTNRAGVAGRSWPITCGIPFPQGDLGSETAVRVLAPEGEDVPCQGQALVRWPDGSVKWLLVDFQADVPKEGRATYRLEYGRKVKASVPQGGLEVMETPEGVRITTGPLQVTVERGSRCIPGRISRWNEAIGAFEPVTGEDGSELRLVDADGVTYAGRVDRVEVEEAGPERAVVRIEVSHVREDGGTLFRSVLRVHAFRGLPWLRIFHTFENNRMDSVFTSVREMVLSMGVVNGSTLERTGVKGRIGRHRVDALDRETVRLLQDTDRRYAVYRDGAVVARGRHAEGWVEVYGEGGGVLAGVRDFWENYPASIGVASDRIEVGLLPDVSGTDYRVGGLEEDRLFFYLTEGTYKLRRGVARTHELLVYVVGEGASIRRGRAVGALFGQPPVVRAPAEVYVQSGVLGEPAPTDGERFPTYEAWVRTALSQYAENRRMRRAYGVLNFGDWHGERRYNWGNMEYDTPWGWLLEALRGGDVRSVAFGEQAAQHLMDVDTCHHDPSPARIGGQYAHCMGHVGDYYPTGYREMATAVGGMSPSHTWVEGPFLYYALTGDRRAREVVEQTCRSLFTERLNHYDFTNCRDSGWLLIHAMGAYQATGGRFFLNAASIIVERVLERQRPSGGWERLMVPGHCFCPPPRHMGNAGFMVGILLSGLKRYHQATGDPAVATCIVRGAEYLVREMWVEEEAAFHYTSCPESAVSPTLNMQVLEGIAYAERLSGSETLRDVVIRGVRRCLPALDGSDAGAPGLGKSISMVLRSAPFLLFDLGRLGERF